MSVQVLVDPMKNEVHLPSGFGKLMQGNGYLDGDLSVIILKLAMVFTVPGPTKLLYHLRSVDWGVTILLKSEWRGAHWFVSDCICNPDTCHVAELLRMGSIAGFEDSGD